MGGRLELFFREFSIVFFLLLLFSFLLSSNVFAAKPLPYNYITVLPQEQDFDPHSAFSTDLQTGAATHTYEFKVPPGTNDLEPELRFFYNSHLRHSRPGFVGNGWRITQNYVQRDINFTRNDPTDDIFFLIFNGASYELTNTTAIDNKYHTKIESFFDIQFIDSGWNNTYGAYWTVRTKDGTTYRYGLNESSELNASENTWVTRWNLDEVEDIHGNNIFYTYLEDPFPGEKGTVYPHRIEYNNDKTRIIEFVYEDADRVDIWEVFDEGHRIKEKRRVQEIRISADSLPVRKYLFWYNYSHHYNPNAGNKPAHSVLVGIQEIGSDNVTSLPTQQFAYNEYNKRPTALPWGESNDYKMPNCIGGDGGGCFVDISGNDNGIRMADVNRDGLVDILRARQSDQAPSVLLNTGSGWVQNTSLFTYPECQEANGNHRDLCFNTAAPADNGVLLDDINGDGYTDIVKAAFLSNGTRFSKVYINNGTGWEKNDTYYTYPRECSDDVGGGNLCFTNNELDHGVRLIDVNGDNLPDIVKARAGFGGSPSSEIWLNNGSGWSVSGMTYPRCGGGGSSTCFVASSSDGRDNGVRIADINGDGLPDITQASASGTTGSAVILLNTGNGWESDPAPSDPIKHPCETISSTWCYVEDDGRDKGVRLADVNGDGLADLARGFGSNSDIYLANGHGWSNSEPALKLTDCGEGNQLSHGCFVDSSYTDNGARMVDVNGDGAADHIIARANAADRNTHIRGVDGAIAILVENITYSAGGFLNITYKKSTQTHIHNATDHNGNDLFSDLGFPLMVVETLDEANSIPDGGLATVHKARAIKNFEYSNGLYDYEDRDFRGFANVTERRANITVINHEFYQDDGRKGREFKTEIIDNETTPQALYQQKDFTWNTTLANNYFTTFLIEENTSQFDGATTNIKVSNINYSYDPYGNIVLRLQGGDTSIENDERYEHFAYVYNTNAYIVDTVSTYLLYGDEVNTTKLRETKYSYDGQTHGTAPTKGDITKEEKTVEGTNTSITQYTYDVYGNILTKTDPNNRQTTFTYGVHDPTFTFADTETNAKGHVIGRWYNLGTGNLQSLTDPNKLNINYTYDILGRITAEIKPLDTFAYPTKVYTYEFDGIPPEKVKVQLREQNETANTLDLYEFIDGLGKIIQTKVEAENNKQIVEDTFYDERFLVKSRSNKYFAPASENYLTPNHTIGFTSFSYDALERVTKTINPDDSEKRFVYDRWLETQTDENGNQKDIKRDAHAQIVQVVEYNPTAQNTNYTYNSAGELIRVHDAVGNILHYTYDLRGLKRSEVDGDLGNWTYTYDPAGNQVEIRESHGNITTFTYDELNRVTRKRTPSELDFTYVYDTLVKGTLSSISSANFSRTYDYDERLRVQGETKTIDGITHSLNFSYDSLDRPVGRELRNRDAVGSTYTAQGILDSLTVSLTPETIMTSTTHTETNAPLLRTYGNSETTQFIYNESNFRLQKLQTGTKQDLAYTFDNLANVVSIADAVHSRTYAMLYDKLSRLTGTTRYDGSEQIFNFTYAYNAIGNMLSIRSPKENLTFSYNGTTTHAPYRIDYEAAAEGVVIDSLNNLTGGSLTTVFEFLVNNTETIGMTDVSWSLFTDATNITSQGNLTLSPREDLFVYVEYTYGGAGTYPVLVTIAGLGNTTENWYSTNQTFSVKVP